MRACMHCIKWFVDRNVEYRLNIYLNIQEAYNRPHWIALQLWGKNAIEKATRKLLTIDTCQHLFISKHTTFQSWHEAALCKLRVVVLRVKWMTFNCLHHNLSTSFCFNTKIGSDEPREPTPRTASRQIWVRTFFGVLDETEIWPYRARRNGCVKPLDHWLLHILSSTS